ncbi:MAG: radical SAM protein [Chloroflexi bacterium]|nr:radical SAM protein [Chloroflexota bacterium]
MVEAKPATLATYRETTASVCPQCLTVVAAEIFARDGRIFMRKSCPEHGRFEALLSSDAKWYVDSLPFNKPGIQPLGYSTPVCKGHPWDCGLCPDHKQHTCLALIEVTSACNQDCPVCFADSQPAFSLSVAQVGRMLDRFIELDAEQGVIQFSGGEPTTHPDILTMLRLAKDKGIRSLMLNTNGARIATDDRFLARLADIGPTIYFQFDGFSGQTHLTLRGKDLLPLKLKALDRMAQAGLDVVLVPAIEKGVNHEELGEIVKFGIEHPAVRGVAFQPVTHAGRHNGFDPLYRETIPDIVHGIAEQTDGLFVESDFIPVPCCHPTCRAATYAYVDRGKVTPLPRVVAVDRCLNYVTNRTLPDLKPELLKALEGLWSASSVPGTVAMAHRFCCAAGSVFPAVFNYMKTHVFMIVIQDFADAYSMDLNAVRKCCVGELVPDGRIIPFCVYNSLGYREKVRAALAAGEMGG